MKKITGGKPVVGKIYTLNDQLYEWTKDELWHRLTVPEIIKLYQSQTFGDVTPEEWLEEMKGKHND